LEVETNKGTNRKVQICTNGNKSVISFAKIETGSGNLQPEVEFNEYSSSKKLLE